MYVWYTCIRPAYIFVIAIPSHLCYLLHLQQTRKVVMVVTIAPGKQACIPTSSQDGNEHLQHADTLLRGCFFVLLQYTPFSWLFAHIDSKKVCTLIKHSVTKISVISSVQYTLPIIISFFEGNISQSMIFYANNMILWYYQILESAWCKDWLIRFLEQTQKHYHYGK